jgi:hypothetical protein
MRTTRARQIDQVASIVRDYLESLAGLDADEDDLLSEAKARNDAEGWTFDMALHPDAEVDGGRGEQGWVRCEGVKLGAAEWDRAVEIARRWMDDELIEVARLPEMLGVSYQRVDQFVRDGRLPIAVHVGPIRRVRMADVRRLAAEPRQGGRPKSQPPAGGA